MEIVIDIPEEYRSIFEENSCKEIFDSLATNEFGYVLRKAFENGIPLPKGHGRIGDLDALREEVFSWGMNDYEPSDFTDAIDEAPTIIERDNS